MILSIRERSVVAIGPISVAPAGKCRPASIIRGWCTSCELQIAPARLFTMRKGTLINRATQPFGVKKSQSCSNVFAALRQLLRTQRRLSAARILAEALNILCTLLLTFELTSSSPGAQENFVKKQQGLLAQLLRSQSYLRLSRMSGRAPATPSGASGRAPATPPGVKSQSKPGASATLSVGSKQVGQILMRNNMTGLGDITDFAMQ